MAAGWRRLRFLLARWSAGLVAGQHNSGVMLGVLALFVAALSVADYVTGPLLSLDLFYMLPTAVGAMTAGRGAGLALALESGVATAGADYFGRSDLPLVSLSNGVLLVMILAITVGLIDAVRNAALSAREAAAKRREFLAYAAHQLRTPLAGIRASTDALLVSGATSQQERLLVNLSREADRAGKLLASLLQMARIDQGETPTPQPLDVVELCQAELDRPRPGRSDVTTRLVIANRPDTVLISGEATRDALANLLDNARRHARERVTVEVGGTAGSIQIAVVDDGPGLPEGMSERVFERFVSLDGEGGSGLGLPIARGLIEAQGGRLTYEDHRFVIRLPSRRPTSPS